MEPANPEMLVLARELRGLTQSEVAKKAGIVQATVSKYENGTLEVSNEHLQRIARVLEFPPAFFRQEDRVFGSM